MTSKIQSKLSNLGNSFQIFKNHEEFKGPIQTEGYGHYRI